MTKSSFSFLSQIRACSRMEVNFISLSCLLSFFIALDYSIVRPSSASLFISAFGAHSFVYVWLACVPVNFFLIYLYNTFLPRWGCLKVFTLSVMGILVINTTTALFCHLAPVLSFIQFLWKDIYILLMFKQMWSLIHSHIASKRAKYIYGLIIGCGGVGSILGSLIPGFCASALGSQKLFLFSLPIYLTILWIYFYAYKMTTGGGNIPEKKQSTEISLSEGFSGFRIIRKSSMLIFIVLIVVFMQLSVGLTEYQFNIFLEKNFTQLDLRTEYTGKLLGIVNFLYTPLQFVGGYFFLHLLGLKRAHLSIPLLLLSSTLLFMLFPSLGVASFCFAFIKTVDFSFFSVLREVLYVPLKPEEKFQAKAVIDVFAYRSSKGVASLLILFFSAFFPVNKVLLISALSLMILVFWSMLVMKTFKGRVETIDAVVKNAESVKE